MEKKIATVSALCFLMIGLIAVLGVLIEDVMMRRIVVVCGCLVVVWLTTLNFKYLKLMKKQAGDVSQEIPSLVHWLQGETWPEILGREKLKTEFGDELDGFLQTHPDCAVKGYRIWRTDETEKYFEEAETGRQQILVLMDRDGEVFQVYGSEALQRALEERYE